MRQGFALIEVPGIDGVRGYLDHTLMGRTDSHGRLFVPDVLPYYDHEFSISVEEGAYSLNYNLYQDLTHLVIWGDGTTGLSESILGVSGTTPVFGVLPSGQTVSAGDFSDSVTMTIVF